MPSYKKIYIFHLNLPMRLRWENISPPSTNSNTMYKLELSYKQKRAHLKIWLSCSGGKDTINWYLNKQARDVCMVRTTSDKQYLKDFSFSRTSYSFLWPPLITLLARTRHRVIYDSTSLATIDHITSYYFPQQRYDLQMRLMYRNGIWNKETEITYCSCTKMFLHSSWVLQVLTPTMSQIFLGKII